MKSKLLQITGKLFLIMGVFCFFITFVKAQECNIKITNPQTDNMEVGMNITVQGTGTNIPNDAFLWVLVHRTAGFKTVWWPQGSSNIDPLSHKWEVFITFGGPQDVGFEFEIAVIVVNKTVNAQLQAYYNNAMTNNNWPPQTMPETVCPPVIRKVMKKTHM